MGNGQSKNDDFSNNPNFNMNAHRQAMQTLGSNYVQANLSMPINYGPNIRVQQTEFKKVSRSCSIYKPSFNIHVKNDTFLLQFQYDSTNSTNVQIYIGVIDVVQDMNSQVTIKINSKIEHIEQLAIGKKLKFTKLIELNGYTAAQSSTFIIRMVSQVQNQATEYSLKKVRQPNQHWKVILQKFELNNIVTQLSNIYKGDQTNECIICLTQTANTLIEPCNHLCLCKDCLNSVKASTNKCPICRNGISNFKVIVNNS